MAYGCAYSVLGDLELAEDAAQEAFLEAWRNLGKLRNPAAFPGWFRRIVRFRCSRLVRGKRVTTVPLEAAGEVSAPGPSPAGAPSGRAGGCAPGCLSSTTFSTVSLQPYRCAPHNTANDKPAQTTDVRSMLGASLFWVPTVAGDSVGEMKKLAPTTRAHVGRHLRVGY